jgi:uncharacterized repeat protein (TIGR03806 family)
MAFKFQKWTALPVLWLSWALCTVGESPVKADSLKRVPNTTLRLPAEIGTVGYRTAEVWPGLRFNKPVDAVTAPGDPDRLFVIERSGRILVLNNLAAPTVSVFLDISDRVDSDYANGGGEGLTGLAFHPGYRTNRFFFVVYTTITRTGQGSGRHNRLSRFEIASEDPNRAVASTETPLITQFDQVWGHNFNDVDFGPDGYLYMAAGDEGGSHDEGINSQLIDKDFFSGILRIDVDHRLGSLPPNAHPASSGAYRIPPDNPFVGVTQFNGRSVDPQKVRTEFWAVGLRNPWRITFDFATGSLYCGDVGQHAAEEINLIERGKNYEWAYFEGTLDGFKGAPPSGYSGTRPLVEVRHGFGPMEAKSIVGGVIYRGQRLPELRNAYVFGDYVTGNIWTVRHEGERVTEFKRLTDNVGLVSFATDPRNGDVLIVNHEKGELLRLEQSIDGGGALPPTLSETGAFSDLAALTPHAGIVPYEVNLPFWSDDARKRRWFSVPQIDRHIGFRSTEPWSIPEGTVWIKHFELELIRGDPTSVRRIETRFLVKTQNQAYGVTYRWDPDGGNAVLVPEEGLTEPIEITDGGVVRTQNWRYPSRSECMACHTPGGGIALGFNTAQLNRAQNYGGNTLNQIDALQKAGYFDTTISNVHTLPRLAKPDDESVSREFRVRSYLAVNCAQCHHPGGTAQGFWDARLSTPTAAAGLLDGMLVNNGGNPNNRVIKPGVPERSVLLTRMAAAGSERMPPICSTETDSTAIKFMSDWIVLDAPGYETFSDWQKRIFGSATAPEARADADPDQDGARNALEHLVGTNPLQSGDAWQLTIRLDEGKVKILFPQIANRAFELQTSSGFGYPWQWQPLNIEENAPFFSGTNRAGQMETVIENDQRFFRMRIYSP